MTYPTADLTAPPRRKTVRAISVLLLLSQAIMLGCADSSSPTNTRDNSAPEPVIAEAVHWQERTTEIEAVGTSRARQTITLYPEISGKATAVTFSAGDAVEAGQTLVQLDDRDERLAVELAQVQLADAERLYQRYLNSKGAGAVTESTLDTAQSAVEQARIQLQRAQVALDDHAIVAPFAGVMGLTDIDPGAWVTPTTAIATIDDRSVLLVTFEVPEALYGQLEQGQPVALTTWRANGPQFEAVIHAIGSQIDAQTRTFAVRAAVDNAEDYLRPGMSFKVGLALSEGRYPLVPEIALQWGGDGAFLWKVEDGQTTRVAASVVQRVKGKVLVDAELEDGARVVTEGIHRVREGQAVESVGPRVAQ